MGPGIHNLGTSDIQLQFCTQVPFMDIRSHAKFQQNLGDGLHFNLTWNLGDGLHFNLTWNCPVSINDI